MKTAEKVTLVLVGIAILAGGAAFISAQQKQDPSECTKAEKYIDSTSRCVNKTGGEYAQELAIADEKAAAIEQEKGRRNGTVCIPQSEVLNYIGVNGCVRMGVQHYYIASYGWAWLDSSESSKEDFSVAALGRGIITKSDAEYYLGKIINVHGLIELYNGAPQIKIDSKDAITDVTDPSRPEGLVIWNELSEKEKQEIQRKAFANFKNFGKTASKSKEKTLSERRSECFEEKMKSATTATQKEAAYSDCNNP